MNIYISHARKDSGLALQLAEQLKDEGLTVVYPETEFDSDDNWAMKIAKALENAEFMIFLLTPGAMKSDWLRMDAEFALGTKKFDGRVYTLFVGPTLKLKTNVPWILLKQPHRQLESAKGFAKVVKEIESQWAASEKSSAHA